MDLQDKVSKLLNMTKANGSVKYDCDVCKDGKGWIINIETNTARPCQCQESNKYKTILDNSGITEAFLKRTFGTYKPKTAGQAKAKNKAIEYTRDFEEIRAERNNSIAFLCQVGAGKTHLSIAVANMLMKQNIGVRYMQYREAIVTLKQNAMDEEVYQREMSKYKSAPVLLIDDLFKGKVTEADINLVYEIINYRYLKQMPVIISSEFSTEKLLEFDEAIGSRIIEMCKGRIFEFDGAELNHRLG